MPDTQKQDKKPLSLEASLYKKSVDTLSKMVGKETEARAKAGQSKESILRDLLRSVSADPAQTLKELSESEVPIPGSQEGLIGTIEGAMQGKLVSPFQQRTQPIGMSEASTILKNLLSIRESTQLGTEKQVKEEKAKETLAPAGAPAPTAEREAQIAGRAEGIKALEKGMVENLAAAQKSAPGTYRFLQQYSRSLDELKKFDPDIEKLGIEGKVSRLKATIANSLDQLPETKTLMIQIQPLANGIAREIEGGRVTDQDRAIYANAFANALANPGATNSRLASAPLVDALDKGADVVPVLKQMAAQENDVFDDILNNVFMEYPDLVESVYGKGAKVVKE